MKNVLFAMAITLIVFLAACQESQQQNEVWQTVPPPQQDQPAPQPAPAEPQIHTGVVLEVIQTSSYTYLKLKEPDGNPWVAIKKSSDIGIGDTVSYKNALEMKNFSSRELERTFEVIYFVGRINKESSASADASSPADAHHKPVVEQKDISIEPAEGGVTIGDIFSNRQDYAGKVVRVRGHVTKVNLSIMGRNWIHIQDGTGQAGQHDLIVTSQQTAEVGDVVTFEGAIVLNKDFGYGYKYEVLMENGNLLARTN